MNQTFIIEHLEKELFEWCLIEYKHISEMAGKENVWFTNIKKEDAKKLEKYGSVFHESVKSMKLNNACVLDPESEKILTSKDKDKFQYVIIGGILGDYPPKKRTKNELTKFLPKYEKRNMGRDQFSTDNAVFVAKKILSGTPLKNIEFIDSPEIEINEVESVILPFKYPFINGKPNISSELVSYIKNKKEF